MNILDKFSQLFRELSKRKINDLQITWSRKNKRKYRLGAMLTFETGVLNLVDFALSFFTISALSDRCSFYLVTF
ncbi:MAG: hypothetical protein DRR08_06995 [Candidatus Parabeggiatoa sp. nov. 2]|nr:MAG: hypothetical protein B6247_13895 [Beggiatoa sp. 4572_84]RKZ62104.1 MAG: hypothetical protein DRR08_06995 [Gammaproteobacteria bacterium]